MLMKKCGKTVSFKEETINHVLTKINDLIGSGQLVPNLIIQLPTTSRQLGFKLIEIPKGKINH